MKNWPADQVERRAVAGLAPYAKNARTHSDAQVAQIAASIEQWGWTIPVLVDEAGSIIAGHGRVLAASRLGIGEVPVAVARGWSEAQKNAYRIADNKLTENGAWNDELLRLELQDLAGLGFDMPLLGFSDEEYARLTQSAIGLTDPDAAPPLPAAPVTRPGDVWILDRHRLVCGDATNEADVSLALDGVLPHLMVTDPPYGVNYEPFWRRRAGFNTPGGSWGKSDNDDRADWSDAWRLFPGSIAYVWHSGLHSATVQGSLERAGFGLRAQIVWVKPRAPIGRGDYHWGHEPVLYVERDGNEDDHWRFIPTHEVASYAVEKGEKANWKGGRKQSTVWYIEHIKSETGHSAQKPIECMKRPIENNSSPGHAVYDPFVGSGTTIIAAEMTARSAHALEINPGYCDVTVKRWEDFTGKKADRVGVERTPEEEAAWDAMWTKPFEHPERL